MLESFGQALLYCVNPWVLVSMFLGVISGLIFGILPGISGMVGVALFLPFAFMLSPEIALPYMIALHAVAYTGGSITAVLLNVPGEASNAATLLDGYPLTQKGEGGRALGAALTSSGVGGVIAVFYALLMIPVVLAFVMAISSSEMVFIILMGLAFIAVLGKGTMGRGLISGGLGLLVSFIGFQVMTGIPRFTFGSLYLYDGLEVVPVALGVFAMPEVISMIVHKEASIAQVKTGRIPGVMDGVRDTFRHWTLLFRCSIIGYIIGIIPGIGGTTACWVAYAQAKQTSKHPERFGTGIVEGVIAPESSIKAKEAGDLLTTLALGIPGGSGMAVLMGGFLIKGVIPGPELMKYHLDLVLALLLIIAIANIVGAIICLLIAPRLARIALIPNRLLGPPILVLIFLGSYAFRAEFTDLIVTFVFTIVGVVMKEYGFSRPGMFLGFILGLLFEQYFFRATGAYGAFFFLRPISLTIFLLTILLLYYDEVKNLIGRWFRRRPGAA